ncbi:hypothetical protein EJD97_003099 [Solanum chilense]|uniref:Uncharacterized protein n=1 Tax=Solanum chilense TaxID=4083 RepID=A0A6N2CIK3_SOLCI|nr:hypothetical protein EJD97_003099 [Solanum chilense]
MPAGLFSFVEEEEKGELGRYGTRGSKPTTCPKCGRNHSGMNTQSTSTRRLDEDIAIVGVPSRGYQDPLLAEVANDDHALANPLVLSDRDIMSDFLDMSQTISTQA